MPVSPGEMERYAPYIANWQRKWARVVEARRERAARARETAERCAKVLAERFGARRVWLFGSTLTPEDFDERSDIDLAVEGIADPLAASVACGDEVRGFEVDLVPLEEAEPSLRHAILEKGERLHGPAA